MTDAKIQNPVIPGRTPCPPLGDSKGLPCHPLEDTLSSVGGQKRPKMAQPCHPLEDILIYQGTQPTGEGVG